jgi:WD40 repeat protein/class 3 adenylate cyclase/energy-coupling factor transporter ATP-binding protein EcfA2
METNADSELFGRGAPSGTVTFLFTDIEGSTKLLERLREQYAILLDEHQQILRASFDRWNGSEIDTQGDSFFAVFPRAIDAVCCVIEAQRELMAHEWPQAAVVRVRMGLHTGEPLQVRTGYVGMDVHRAARIASSGHGGQVLLSQTTRDLVVQDLPKGASLRDLGQHKLKDIRFPQQIYQLDIEGLAAEFPSLKTLSVEEEPPTPGETPYKGLQYFDEADAEWFFGREQVSQKLAQVVKEQRFLAVIGASGSGKSSAVRAGLVPALKSSQPGRWQVHIITPSSHPLESLAVSLTRGEPSVSATTTLIDDLRQDPRSLHLYVLKALIPSQRGEGKVLLVVDQFEELFTQCRDEIERQAFVDNLLYAAAAEDGPTRVVIALRADFYQHLAQYAGLRTEVAKHQEYLGAMEAAELRQAIEEPAQRGGWEFSPGLVELMLHDIGATEGHQPEPGALPLLSHALLETWKRRRANLMSLRAYSEAGGVRGAIAKSAESVYYGMLTPEQQPIARNIFLRLTELGEGTQDTRRCVSIHELIPPAPTPESESIRDVLVKLADARLITTSEGTVEVAHEALIREWPLLREWLAQDREGLRLHRHITESAQEWERMERDPGALYRGARLAQAIEWAQANPSQMNTQEQAFLDASQEDSQREAWEREEQRQRELEAAQKLAAAEKQRAEEQAHSASRLRRRALYLSIAVIMAGMLAVAAILLARMAGDNAQTAQANARSAQTAEAQAEIRSTQAIAQQATAESEALIRATAEVNAQQQRQVAEEQSDLAGSRELAAASAYNLGVDPQLSILLALEALKKAYSLEAENALHQAMLASRLIASIPAGSQSIFGVAASPEGSKFATAGMDGVVKVWAMSDINGISVASPLLTLENPIDFEVSQETGGSTIAFSPDGSDLASIAEKGSVNIWDANSGQLLQTLSSESGNVNSIAFDPHGQRLITTSSGGETIIWDIITGQKLWALTTPENVMYAGIISPDGKWLITGSEEAAHFWNLENMSEVELFSLNFDYSTEGPPGQFVFSPDGKYLAIGACPVSKVWDVDELQADSSAKPVFALFGHKNCINGLAYTPDGSRLITGSADGTAKVWDATTGQEMFTLVGGSGNINSLAISPDGIHPLSAHSDGRVRVWDISPTGSHEGWTIYPAHRSRFSPDGKRLATGFKTSEFTGETTFRMWELSPSGVKEMNSVTVNPGARVSAYGFNADLSRYATIGADMNLKLWEPLTGELIQSLPISETSASIGHTDFVFGFDFSPDGALVATVSDDGKAIIWDLASGKAQLIMGGHEGPVRGVAFSPDSDLLATASFDGTARIWNTSTGQLLQTLMGHEGGLMNVTFSLDGKRLLTGSGDTTGKVWDVETGKELITLTGHTSTVFWVDFSPDGTRIATGSVDGYAKVWDASTGQTLLTLPGFYVRFSPDGKSLMAISIDDAVGRGFYLDVQELIALAHSRLTRSLTTAECQQYLHLAQCPAE